MDPASTISDTIETIAVSTSLGTDALLLLLYVGIALVFSFMCSIGEPSLLGITPSYIAAGFSTLYVNVLIKTMYPLIVVSEKLTKLI